METGSSLRKSFPAAELARVLGAPPVSHVRVESGGYGRVSAHWRVELADGRRLFVKQALTDGAAEWVGRERRLYESVDGSFLPRYLGGHDDGSVWIALEDLTDAEWPPPWSDDAIAAVLDALAAVRATMPPAWLAKLDDMREDIVGWPRVAADPQPFLTTRLCTQAWLGEALPVLVEAAQTCDLAGDELLHLDVRSDNLCLVDGRAVLFDWNLACSGNGRFDVAFWLPSLRLEGGPEPGDVFADAGALAAAVAGFFAVRAGLPPPAGAPTVREFQRAQAAVALPWAARELGLTLPS
jgi:hypothetical protein